MHVHSAIGWLCPAPDKHARRVDSELPGVGLQMDAWTDELRSCTPDWLDRGNSSARALSADDSFRSRLFQCGGGSKRLRLRSVRQRELAQCGGHSRTVFYT